ncbi:hypothetical protein RHMOL_Rhmol01G0011300 [Rhododendron molle]|uniref:Uncharacterized protein n=1 Tax=Rhododendron molle TaxID=49168 RepID=A0ACC0PYB5_RHOML|nr:hypothetical protein RHMOL_Rhmol01G0011300 [Rhododendron molle]
MVRMAYFMSCTMLYFQCKKTHGEEIELQEEGLEYSSGIRNDGGGANWKRVLVNLFFANVILRLWRGARYICLFYKVKSSDANPICYLQEEVEKI